MASKDLADLGQDIDGVAEAEGAEKEKKRDHRYDLDWLDFSILI